MNRLKYLSFGVLGLLLIFILLLFVKVRGQEVGSGTGLKLPILDSINKLPYAEIELNYIKNNQPPVVRRDLSPYLPPSLDQGRTQASCVAFCLSYELLSYYERMTKKYSYNVKGNLPDFNTVFSPSFVFSGVKINNRDANCLDGISFFDAFNFIQDNGTAKWALFPYDKISTSCIGNIGSDVFKEAQKMKGYTFYKISSDRKMLKAYLTQNIPVIIGIYTSKSMYENGLRHKNIDKPYIWNPAGSDLAQYHAMLCVGFDDIKKCFILMNSWGGDWGNKGYCYIPYDRFYERVREFYIVKLNRASSWTDKDSTKEKPEFFDIPKFKYGYRKSDSSYNSLFGNDLAKLEAMSNRTEDQEKLMNELQKLLKK